MRSPKRTTTQSSTRWVLSQHAMFGLKPAERTSSNEKWLENGVQRVGMVVLDLDFGTAHVDDQDEDCASFGSFITGSRSLLEQPPKPCHLGGHPVTCQASRRERGREGERKTAPFSTAPFQPSPSSPSPSHPPPQVRKRCVPSVGLSIATVSRCSEGLSGDQACPPGTDRCVSDLS